MRAALLVGGPDTEAWLAAAFAVVDIPLGTLDSLRGCERWVTQASAGDLLVLDCSSGKQDDLERCRQVAQHAALTMLMVHAAGQLHPEVGVRSRGPMEWISEDCSWRTLLATLRRLKLQSLEARGASPAAVLSERQYEVLALLAEGLSNAKVAARLQLGEGTASRHAARIKEKLGVATVAELRSAYRWMTCPPVVATRGERGSRVIQRGRLMTPLDDGEQAHRMTKLGAG